MKPRLIIIIAILFLASPIVYAWWFKAGMVQVREEPDTSQWVSEHSKIPIPDTLETIIHISQLNTKRLGWIITAQDSLMNLHGKRYDKYFHYALRIQNSYTDSIVELENMIGNHEFDKYYTNTN